MALDGVINSCQARGIAKIDDQKAAVAKKDIVLLEDMVQLFTLLPATEMMAGQISEQGLTAEVNSLYFGAFAGIRESDPLKRTLLAIDATLEAINSIKSARKKKALENDQKALNKIKDIIETAQSKYAEVLNKLSPAAQNILKQILSTIQGPFGILEVPKLVKSSIQNISLNLSDPTKNKLGIGKAGWMEKLTREKVEKVISEFCQSIKYVKKDEPKLPPPPPPPPKKPKFDISVAGAAGYYFASGSPIQKPGNPAGIQGQGSVLGGYAVNDRTSLQAYYAGRVNVANNFKQAKQGNDEAALGVKHESERTEIQVRAGWTSLRTLDPKLPNSDGAFESARFIYRFNQKLSLDVDEHLFSGFIGDKWKTQGQVEPGVSYLIGYFRPVVGAIGGYDQQTGKPIYGGFAGLTALFGKRHEANLLVDYTNINRLQAQARYFFNHKKWGIGPTVLFSQADGTNSINGGIAWIIRLGEIFKKLGQLEAQGSVTGGYSSSGRNIGLGLGFRWGKSRLPIPSPLRRDSIVPLPEGM